MRLIYIYILIGGQQHVVRVGMCTIERERERVERR